MASMASSRVADSSMLAMLVLITELTGVWSGSSRSSTTRFIRSRSLNTPFNCSPLRTRIAPTWSSTIRRATRATLWFSSTKKSSRSCTMSRTRDIGAPPEGWGHYNIKRSWLQDIIGHVSGVAVRMPARMYGLLRTAGIRLPDGVRFGACSHVSGDEAQGIREQIRLPHDEPHAPTGAARLAVLFSAGGRLFDSPGEADAMPDFRSEERRVGKE